MPVKVAFSQIVIEILRRSMPFAVGQSTLIGDGLGLVEFFELGGFGALVAFGNLLELIGQRADFAARDPGSPESWRRAGDRANRSASGSGGPSGSAAAAGGIHRGLQLLVIGRGVEGLFCGLALRDLLLQIAGV